MAGSLRLSTMSVLSISNVLIFSFNNLRRTKPMFMRRFCFMIALFAITALSFAQLTIHDTDFPGVGFTVTHGTASATNLTQGSSGPNQTWTVGDYTWNNVGTSTVVDPATAPHISRFPTANRCVHETEVVGGLNYEGYTMAHLTSSAYQLLGFDATDSAIVYDQPAQYAVLPATYQTTWTQVVRTTFSILGYTIVSVDSTINTVDAWGSITTPYYSRNVLRVFSHTWAYTVTLGFPGPTTEHVAYEWVDQHGNPVVTMTSPDGVTSASFTSGDIQMLGVPNAVEPARGPVAKSFAVGQNFPNPFNPTTSLPISLEKNARVTVDVFDETGRLASHQEMDMPAGSFNVPVQAAGWSSGSYFARVSTPDQQQTVKMQLVK
jgi:hypothetical protein